MYVYKLFAVLNYFCNAPSCLENVFLRRIEISIKTLLQYCDSEEESWDHCTQEVHRQIEEGKGGVRQLHATGWLDGWDCFNN